jgi:hypothetical protein
LLYIGAKNRCSCNKSYRDQGIRFLFHSFEEFARELGRVPSAKHEVDRIDTTGHYAPGNVRYATKEQQAWNRKKYRGKYTSKFKGVCWLKTKKRWFASICVSGRDIRLGMFRDEREAARAYDKAAREHFKEFACLNFRP